MIRRAMTGLLLLTLGACGGGGAGNPAKSAGSGPGATAAPAAYRELQAYIAPVPRATDRDFDGIPDAADLYPDQAVVLGEAYGDSALVIEQVFAVTAAGAIDGAAAAGYELHVAGRGLASATGQPLLIFTGNLDPIAVVPQPVDQTTWRVTPPAGARGVFAVIGNHRSNAVPLHWLEAGAPALLHADTSFTSGSSVVLPGIDLATVANAYLGTDPVEILSASDQQLQIRLPAAPTSNVLRVVDSNGLVSNSIDLRLEHTIRLALATDLALPEATVVSGRHAGQRFDVAPGPMPSLPVTGHAPVAFYFDVDAATSGLGTIAWPDQSTVAISSATTLMADLWINRVSLPIKRSMDWRDARAFLEAAVATPAGQAFISGHQSWLAGDDTWDRYAARQDVMDAIVATAAASSPVMQRASAFGIDALDDIVAFTISPETRTTSPFGDNTTVDLPRADIPGTSYAQIEVAAHEETRLLLGICDYPPNTPVPAGIWPSDLCLQNDTAVFASFAVYQPKTVTFGNPYSPRPADLVRRHIDSAASGEAAAEGAVYLTNNLGGTANQPPLCRMQTCFVEVLTGGFGNGFKDYGLNSEQRRVVRDLRMKWVFEGMIIPILADKLGLAQLPACLPGEMYANVKFYERIDALVAAIRAGRASLSIIEAKQLFDDIVGEWLKGILTGALAEEGNIVNCVATQIAKAEIKDRLVGATQFGTILNDALFVGGLILTPEKFVFKVQYRAEIADVYADAASDGVTTLVDTVNGLYLDAAQTRPRMLSITGTWIANQDAADPSQDFYPLIIFRDAAGNTESFLTDSRHYVDTGQVAFRKLNIPVLELVENSGTDLNRLLPGMIDVSVEFIHASLDGYPGRQLRVPSPVSFLLKNKPLVLGFTPSSAPPDAVITVNGTSLRSLGSNPGLALYRDTSSGNFSCAAADPATRIAVPPADVLDATSDSEIQFRLPASLSTEKFYFLCLAPGANSTAGITGSSIPLFTLDLNRANTGLVSFSDFGRNKDDAIRLSVLGNNGMPIAYVDQSCPADGPSCQRNVSLVFDIPNPEDGKRLRTLFWDNNVLNTSYGLNARSLLLECMNTGTDSDCTFGIAATNVQIDGGANGPVSSDAGKFGLNAKREYLIVYP